MPYMTDTELQYQARAVADDIIADARNIHGPVVWVTGNNYMPPMRALPSAEAVWQADNNDDGELWASFTDLVEEYVAKADVLLECCEWDNALFAVDLKRWRHRADFAVNDDINDDWESVSA